MAISEINLADKQQAERKLLITVVEWEDENGTVTIDTKKYNREVLGTRTPDSSIEYNSDISTETDIRGINYTDVNKTQPQQSFDPFKILGGSKLAAKLNDLRRRNAVSEFSQFRAYVITAYIGDSTNGFEAERHDGCTISIDSLGGDAFVNMPITLYLSNNWEDSGAPGLGTVDKLSDDFVFTAA